MKTCTTNKPRVHTSLTLLVLLTMLVCAQLMSGGLSFSAFKTLHVDALLSGYDAVGGELANKINRSLRLGKPLDNFVGMKQLLWQTQQFSPNIKNLSILRRDGSPVMVLNQYSLPSMAQIVAGADTAHATSQSFNIHQDANYHIIFLLRNRESSVAGYLCLSFTGDQMDAQQQRIIYASASALGITTLIAALLLSFGFYFIFNNTRLQRRRIIYLFLFVVLGGAQLIYCAYTVNLFQEHYRDVSQHKAVTMASLLQRDVNALLGHGVPLEALNKIDKRMAQIVERVAEIATLDIVADTGITIYHAGSDRVAATRLVSYLPIMHGADHAGQIRIVLDAEVLRTTTQQIALDSLTVVALSFLFIMELMVFLFATLLAPLALDGVALGQTARRDLLIRPATFIYIYAVSLCFSFIPLYMAQLYQPIAGISRGVLLGLPLTMEMLGGGLVLIPVGRWIDRHGWHQAFIIGTLISIGGATLSGLAHSEWSFVAARTFMGVGYGMVWMSAQGFVLINAAPNQRARGISNVVAGIFSGIICGNAVGAMLAQQIGFRQVFFVSAGLIVIALLFSLVFMRHRFQRPPASLVEHHGQEQMGLRQMLKDGQVWLLFGCSLVPYSVAMVGLLYYVTPIYLKQLGTSQSTIGRVIMVFGLCMIFIAPRVSHFADSVADKRLFLVAGGVLGGLSLLVFTVSTSFWAMPVAVGLFGLSVSVSAASRNVLAIGLPITAQLGTTRVMGVYRSIDKIAQAAGPLLLALLLNYLPMQTTMATIGCVYLLFTVLLMWGLKTQVSCHD